MKKKPSNYHRFKRTGPLLSRRELNTSKLVFSYRKCLQENLRLKSKMPQLIMISNSTYKPATYSKGNQSDLEFNECALENGANDLRRKIKLANQYLAEIRKNIFDIRLEIFSLKNGLKKLTTGFNFQKKFMSLTIQKNIQSIKDLLCELDDLLDEENEIIEFIADMTQAKRYIYENYYNKTL